MNLGAPRLAVPVLYTAVLPALWGGLISTLGVFGGVLAFMGTAFGGYRLLMVRDRFNNAVYYAEFYSEHLVDEREDRAKARAHLRDAIWRLPVWPYDERLAGDSNYWGRALKVGEWLAGEPAEDRPARSPRRWTAMAAPLEAVTGVPHTAARPCRAQRGRPAHEAESRLVGQLTEAGFAQRADPKRPPLLDARGDLVVGAMPDEVMTLPDELRSLTYTIEHKRYLDERYWPAFRGERDGSATPRQISEAWHNRPHRPRASTEGFEYTIAPDAQRNRSRRWCGTPRWTPGRSSPSRSTRLRGKRAAHRRHAAHHRHRRARHHRSRPADRADHRAARRPFPPHRPRPAPGPQQDRASGTRADRLLAEARRRGAQRCGGYRCALHRPGRRHQRRRPRQATALRAARPTRPAPGEPVIAVGYPGVEPGLQRFALAGGPAIRTGNPREFSYFGWPTRGVSGGALFNVRGQLIAPLTKSASADEPTVTSQSGPEFTAFFDAPSQGRAVTTGSPRRGAGGADGHRRIQ